MGIKDKLKTTVSRRAKIAALIGTLIVAGSAAAVYYTQTGGDNQNATGSSNGKNTPGSSRRGERQGNRPQPVKATEARIGNLDILVSALGTVTASNTATVKPRVDGQLIRVNFHEGQSVKAGEVLAEIDPRPFQIQLDQASGQLTRDEALLAAARVDLERYRSLLSKDSIAKQQVDTQEALVRQYRGVVESDKAQVDNARLQLGFTRISAPAAGRLGLRLVDVGNNIRATDAGGLVVITQTQPIHTVFSIPAESVGKVVNRLAKGETLAVEAWDRDGRTLLTNGKLISVDNQIDVATGTLKLKAEFANRDNSLFPNQFVNIRLKVATLSDSLLLASAAIQRNAQGSFVYVIQPEDQTVTPRPLRLGPSNGETVAVEAGLKAGEQVVLDGADRLRPGSKVDILSLDGKSFETAPPSGQKDGTTPSEVKRPGNEAKADSATSNVGNNEESRGQRRCSPEKIANDPAAAERCERWRQRRAAEGNRTPPEGGRRAE